jgi:Cyclin, N-terminal domain/Cyclin, C-terminal domain
MNDTAQSTGRIEQFSPIKTLNNTIIIEVVKETP